MDTCEKQCVIIPIVPPQLKDKFFRGLEIDMSYLEGEWTAAFTDKNVTVTDPSGKAKIGKVTSSAQFLTIHWADGSKLQTLWQYQGGPATDFLSWAWGALNGDAPNSFDSAMTESGNQEFFFVTCPDGRERSCQFKPKSL
jgi:hypothetical protein